MTHKFLFCPQWPWPSTLTLELRRDFCTMHLIAKFHYPMFNHSEVNRVDKQTNWQTNRCRWKHPSRSTVLCWWVNSRIISRATNLVKWNGVTIDWCSVSRNIMTAEMTANLFLLAASHFAVLVNINWSEHQPSSERMAVWSKFGDTGHIYEVTPRWAQSARRRAAAFGRANHLGK